MLFCENPEDRFYERLMKTVPVRRKKDLFYTEKYLDNVLFDINKFNEEREGYEVMFKNEKHKTVFEEAVRKLDKKNYALMSAVYLLTAECRLWNSTGRYVERNKIRFDAIHLKGSTETGYTLYCAAKDLYLGTKSLTISDLADTTLIDPQTFGLICNAMAVRRYGVGAVKFKERTDGK